jgi:hypothetical protein
MRSTVLTLIACALTLPAVAAPEEPLVGDRPDFTESALTIAPGRAQFEAGITDARGGDREVTDVGEVLVRVGLARRTEARIFLGSWVDLSGPEGEDTGARNAALGVKQGLLTGEGARPQLALLASATLPTGSEDLAARQVQPSLTVAAEWDLSERFGLGTNLGWASLYVNERDDRFDSVWLSASLGFSASDRLGLFLEGFGFQREEIDGDARAYADLGATYLITADFQLDIRYGRGFNGVDDEWFAGGGVVWRI